MLKKIIFVVLFGSFSIVSGAQIPDDENPECREKCFHAGLSSRGGLGTQELNFLQSPSMSKFDVKYVKIDIAVEANSRVISGTSLTTARVLETLDTFALEFRNNMTVDSVFINGTKMSFLRENDHVLVRLSPALPAGTTINALYYYRGTANANGVFAGTVPANGLIYTASVSESYQAREWFPAKQLLKDKIDSADIWITTSAINKAGSNGLLKAIVDMPGNKKQYQWKTRYPMAYYLLSFSVGNYMEYLHYAKPASMAPDSVLIQDYIVDNASFFNTNKANLDKTGPFLEKQSELYGLYPYKNEKYGHCHANIGGGMEHQTMSTMATFSTSVIAHELGHQWFGDMVTCATWNHIWINEGFASYTEYLMAETLPALFTSSAAAIMQSIHNDVLASPSGSVFVPDASLFDENRIFSFRFTYNKGSAILHTLRFEMQDDAKFFQTLRTFLQQFKDSVATADDFKAVAQTVCGRSFADFFDQWYYGHGYPTFNVDYSKPGDSIILRINQISSAPATNPFYKGLYEFTIQTAQGDTTVKLNLTENNQVFKFKSNRTPTGVIVDPNNWVLNKTGSITTGTNDVNVSHEVELFPNPSVGTAFLRYPANWFESFSLYDISGKLIERKSINRRSTQETITTSVLPGVYFIQLNGKGRIAIKKLVVAK